MHIPTEFHFRHQYRFLPQTSSGLELDLDTKTHSAQCLKNTQNVAFEIFQFLAFSNNFCPIKSDLSGNTICPQASGFPNMLGHP